MPRFLHVANGTSTTGIIAKAGIPGITSIWADPLHEGPVPGGVSDDELLQTRARHLASATCPAEDVADALSGWRRAIDDHAAYDELVLWYEHDLFDQLNLIQVLDRLGASWPVPVTIVSIGSYPGRKHFKGLGELTPAELAPLFGARARVTEAQRTLAHHAWGVFRSPTPLDLVALLATDTSALPFLAAALDRHVQEFPWTTDGLSRTERRLLDLASVAPVDLHGLFPRMHDLESAFYIADSSLLRIAQDLAACSPPLLTIDPIAGHERRALGVLVTLTDTGQAVLGGREDRVSRCGIDRWLGGVHLTGRGSVWRWDDVERRVREG